MKIKVIKFIVAICVLMLICSVAMAKTDVCGGQNQNANYNPIYYGDYINMQAISEPIVGQCVAYTTATNKSNFSIQLSTLGVEEFNEGDFVTGRYNNTTFGYNESKSTAYLARSKNDDKLEYRHQVIARRYQYGAVIDSLTYIAHQSNNYISH